MAAHEATRQKQINRIWRDHRFLWFVPGLVIGLFVGTFLQPAPHGWLVALLRSFFDGVWPEVLGVFVTITIIREMLGHHEEKSREKGLQEQLIRDAGSLVKDVAVDAVHQLEKCGWLTGDDGLLKGADLQAANLGGANLYAANLEGTGLIHAHLEGANLAEAHLEGAFLGSAHLEGAYLGGAHLEGAILVLANLKGTYLGSVNLEGAFLGSAHLEGANLRYAYLLGASLWEASLEKAYLMGAKFDKSTTLPDGSQWTADTDMTRFTDLEHPDFWRSDDPDSPAYWGKEESE